MNRSKLTKKCQATIPKEIRDLLNVKAGDSIYFTICEDNYIVVKKATPINMGYYRTLWESATEWHSEEDEEAYKNL